MPSSHTFRLVFSFLTPEIKRHQHPLEAVQGYKDNSRYTQINTTTSTTTISSSTTTTTTTTTTTASTNTICYSVVSRRLFGIIYDFLLLRNLRKTTRVA
jgi:hypothetical protein